MSGDKCPVLRLNDRPIDSRRGLPIPFVNETATGEADFASIQADKVLACARRRLCGSCGTDLGYWIAFLGGPRSAEARLYADPPMHPDCAEHSLQLCPHMQRQNHRRAPEHRLSEGVITPVGMHEGKPEAWIMGICRDFTWQLIREGDAANILFQAKPFKRTRRWEYNAAGRLTETNGAQQ